MAKIIDETEKYKELVHDLDECNKKCRDSIDAFFTKIQNIKSWEGNAATDYLDKTLVEKNKCLDFTDSVSKFVENLDSVDREIDTAVASIGR